MTVEHQTNSPYPPKGAQQGPHDLDTMRARQGEAPGHMRYVLTIGTFLVVAAFATIYFLGV
jgi:hypothetical protein